MSAAVTRPALSALYAAVREAERAVDVAEEVEARAEANVVSARRIADGARARLQSARIALRQGIGRTT